MTTFNMKKLAVKITVVVGLWTLVGLLISSVTIFYTIQEGSSVNLLGIFVYEFVCISPWIICTPYLIWVARTYKFKSENLYKSIGIHLVSAIVIFSFHTFVQSNAVFVFYDEAFSWSYMGRAFVGFLDMRILLYTGSLLAVYAFDYQKKSQQVQLKKAELKAELEKAKFHSLLNQIQPQFLISSLDAIDEKLSDNLNDAERLLLDFSELLRIILKNLKDDEVTVQKNIKSFELYVNTLGSRLNQDINSTVEVEADCRKALVPSFIILIPLIENIVECWTISEVQIDEMNYRCTHEENNTAIQVLIEAQNFNKSKISKYFKTVEPEFLENLKNRYGENIKFKTNVGTESIALDMTIPFMVEAGTEVEKPYLIEAETN